MKREIQSACEPWLRPSANGWRTFAGSWQVLHPADVKSALPVSISVETAASSCLAL